MMEKMSPREKAICRGIVNCLSNKEIGKAVGIHYKAVERSIPIIRAKVGGARNRVELAMKLKELSR